ncbi:MAG: hypothetical protein M1832_002469 [Thelocarpon impressellum]|nr:MAG: hypothetical protein M1832_002469 [Thelocarpon impressellum]
MVLLNREHVLHARTARKHRERDPATLWWWVSTSMREARQKVLRSFCNRRMRAAVRSALDERGFDAEGRRKALSDGAHRPGLVGAAQFVVRGDEMLAARNAEVRRQAGVAVDEILRLAGLTARGGEGTKRTSRGGPPTYRL